MLSVSQQQHADRTFQEMTVPSIKIAPEPQINLESMHMDTLEDISAVEIYGKMITLLRLRGLLDTVFDTWYEQYDRTANAENCENNLAIIVLMLICKLIFIENLEYSTLNHQNPPRTVLVMTIYVISMQSRQIFIRGRGSCGECHASNIYCS